MSKSNNTNIILIDKFGKMKTLQVNTKDFKKEDLYKKCGFKKDTDFSKQTEWKITVEKQKYRISVYAKTDGRANTENKYDFPPPIDNTLFFGTCAVISEIKESETSNGYKLYDLSIDLWEKIYEKLFGGFENLKDTAYEDENEDDELANVKSDKKTKQGYLKDGFVVDDIGDDDGEEDDEDEDDDEEEEEDDDEDNNDNEEDDEEDDNVIVKDMEEDEYEDEDEDEDDDEDDDIDNSDEENEVGNKKKGRKAKKNVKKTNGKSNIKVSIVKKTKKGKKQNNDIIEDLVIEDITTELSEEEYDYA